MKLIENVFVCVFQVTGVVGRAETLSAIFFILAFTVYVKATSKRNTTGNPLLFFLRRLHLLYMAEWLIEKWNFGVRTSLVSRFVLIMSSSKSEKWSLTTWSLTSRYNMCTCTPYQFSRKKIDTFCLWHVEEMVVYVKKSADCVNLKWQG